MYIVSLCINVMWGLNNECPKISLEEDTQLFTFCFVAQKSDYRVLDVALLDGSILQCLGSVRSHVCKHPQLFQIILH